MRLELQHPPGLGFDAAACRSALAHASAAMRVVGTLRRAALGGLPRQAANQVLRRRAKAARVRTQLTHTLVTHRCPPRAAELQAAVKNQGDAVKALKARHSDKRQRRNRAPLPATAGS